jgi:hypothetical protein
LTERNKKTANISSCPMTLKSESLILREWRV